MPRAAPAPARVLAPRRNRLGKRALRNLLGVLARRARQDALELRLHQRLASRVVPDEGGNQWSSMAISGACRLAPYRRHVLNDPQRRAATCGLNLSSASTCEHIPIVGLGTPSVAIRGNQRQSEAIRAPASTFPSVIRGSSEGHQRVIREGRRAPASTFP